MLKTLYPTLLKRPEIKNQLMTEIIALRQRITASHGIEQRCQQVEAKLRATEERNRLLGDNAPLGIFIVNTKGHITGINRKMQEMAPWLADTDMAPASLSHGQIEITSDIFADLEQCIIQREANITEHSYRDQQGNRTYLRYSFSPIPGKDGSITEVMAFVEDTTNLKKVERALQESEKRYRMLYKSSPIAMIERDVTDLNLYLEKLLADGLTDLRGYLEKNPNEIQHCWSLIKTIDHNPAFCTLMDLENCANAGKDFTPIDSDIFRNMAKEIILTIAQRNSVNEQELEVLTASGQAKFVLGKSLVVSTNEEPRDRVVVALLDISQRKRAEETLRKSELRFKEQAFRDDLTGLFNRRYLYQSLTDLIADAQADGTEISLIFIDLDHFKQVVDTHGHLNGSRAIHEVAQTIDACLQKPAYAVAYAGDEFVVVLPKYDQHQACQKASEILAKMRDTIYLKNQGLEVHLEASFGVGTFPENAGDVDSLLAAADQALFAVKDSGKNGVGRYQKKEQ